MELFVPPWLKTLLCLWMLVPLVGAVLGAAAGSPTRRQPFHVLAFRNSLFAIVAGVLAGFLLAGLPMAWLPTTVLGRAILSQWPAAGWLLIVGMPMAGAVIGYAVARRAAPVLARRHG